MARLSEHGIRLSSMSPSFLNSNSTSHTWPFSAVAELIDNASDPGVTAKQIWIDVVEEQQELCLTFTDNGSGMTPNKLHKMLSFGFTEKGSGKGTHQAIGVYGNGFKSGSMRLGRDALIFTKNGGCLTVGMLSQTYLQAVHAQAVIVPIVPFNQQTKALVMTEDSEASLQAILEHSLLHSQEELLQHFDSIPSKKGTKILIWNIRRNKDGKPELDFDSDDGDIRMPDVHIEELKKKSKRTFPGPQQTDLNIPEMDYSLRAYLSILYLKPRTQIILRKKKVQTKLVAKSLSHIENDVYKPQFNNERVKVTFGFNRKNKDHYGIMMYHKNRLIKSYEKVGYQIKSSGQRAGVGVIGVIECNFLRPAHNKQDFEYTREYRLTLGALGLKLNDYWREMMEKKAREREFIALEKSQEEDSDTEEEEESPVWLQCEDCLKWRRVPAGHYSSTPEHWNCGQNPIPRFRNCLLPEEAEESEEELTPSYHKTHKKQDQAQVRKRGKSLEDSHTRFRALTRGLSEPTLLRPLPRADLQHTHVNTQTNRFKQDGSEEHEEDKVGATPEGEEDSIAHSSSNKRKSAWPPADLDKRPRPWTEPQQPSDEREEEVQPGKDVNEAQTAAGEKAQGEKALTTRVSNAQPSSSPAWPHSLPSAQTVVVSPLSRPEGLKARPLCLEGGDRDTLVQKVTSLEKEAQRLRMKLGLMATPDAMATTSPSGEKPTGGGAESPVAMATKENTCQTEVPVQVPVQMGRLRREKADGKSRLRQTESGGCTQGETCSLQETLNSIRGNVVALLSAILPHLDLQGISLDTGDVDSILQQIIDANSLV